MKELFGPVVPVLLIALIFGLVQAAKALRPKLEGKWCIVISMLLGLIFGVAYQIATLVPGSPVTFLLVFEFIVYSLVFGLAASGFYDLTKREKPEDSLFLRRT